MKTIFSIAILATAALPALAAETQTTVQSEAADSAVKRVYFVNPFAASSAGSAEASVSSSTSEAPKFTIAPTGRILMDAAAYTSNEKEDFPAGVAIPDARIGVKAGYGKWKAKVDIGFGYGKVSLKDIYMEHDFNSSNLLRFGYFVHQFGLQSATSSSMKISMEEPTSNEIFNYPRLLGFMYVFDKGDYFATASLHAESSAMTLQSNVMGKTGYGGMTRLVWRPRHDSGQIAQVGFSFAAGSAQYNSDPELNHNSYSISANFPTRVAKVNALGATVDDVSAMVKFTPELLLGYGPLALETQYYYFRLNRKHDLTAYTAYGAYAMLRCLAIGGDYQYSHADAGIATPAPKSLEFVLGYNYTNTSCAKAGIMGGRLSDVNLTANWYINKYMIWRLRLGYTHRFDKAGVPDVNLGAIQTRFQIIF